MFEAVEKLLKISNQRFIYETSTNALILNLPKEHEDIMVLSKEVTNYINEPTKNNHYPNSR